MFFSQVTKLSLFLQAAVLFVGVHAQCPWKNGSLPVVPNGYRSNVDNLKLYSDGSAYGYYDVGCHPGYALDASVGARITCLKSGSWSDPLPNCKSQGRCSIPELFNFLEKTPGVRSVASKTFVYTVDDRKNEALGGSNVTVQCAKRYKNIGGPLTIICTEAGKWTDFPNCISTVTTVAPPVRCPYNSDTLTFDHGYLSNTTGFLIYNNNSATGAVTVSCDQGYVMDSTSNGVCACNEGVWSARPFCTKTARCSLSKLAIASRGVGIVSQKILVDPSERDDVLVDSYVQLFCREGYTNTDGNLNVTCNADGQWSPFPQCIGLTTTAAADADNDSVPASADASSE